MNMQPQPGMQPQPDDVQPQTGMPPQPGYTPQHQMGYASQPGGYAPQPEMGYASQPGYAPQAAYPQPQTEIPGKTLGIVGLVLAIVTGGPIGLILSIIGFVQSKKAGFKNGPALAGIIIGSIFTVIAIIVTIVIVVAASAAVSQLTDPATICAAAGALSGDQVTVGGQIITCP